MDEADALRRMENRRRSDLEVRPQALETSAPLSHSRRMVL
jgi:hypothetical protein